jgi:hypothetical protein
MMFLKYLAIGFTHPGRMGLRLGVSRDIDYDFTFYMGAAQLTT